ncbi:cobalamin biosynthesis protein CbiL [Desulfomicrobium salsuginis]
MRRILLPLVLGLLTHTAALAHRVNVFAYVEGGDVVVECSYSKSKRVNRGAIEVLSLQSGETLLTGETDEDGRFRFPVPEAAKRTASGLRIVLRAGEGHQNEWVVDAAEFMPSGSKSAEGAGAAQPAVDPQRPAPGNAEGPGALSRGDVEEIVNAALDAKLAPIRRAVLERTEEGPDMREIIGGIGWIFGIVGLAAYFKSRSRV